MDLQYGGRLKCATCGHDSYFESNHDESYIMCMFCHREYVGGYQELIQLNSPNRELTNTTVEPKVKEEARKNLSDALEMN
jgi:hypothetical protein